MRKLLRRKTTVFAIAILTAIIGVTAFSPWLVPYDPYRMNPRHRLLSPRAAHLFGTDSFGRDVLSRTLVGGRTSLAIGAAVATASLTLGIPIGMMAGYFSVLGLGLMRLVDAVMAFPSIMLALAFMAIMGRTGMVNVILAVGVVYIPRMARVVYSSTLVLRDLAYVEAARAVGASTVRILLRHILVNLLSPVIVQSTFTFAFSVLEAAALDFLGVGVPPEVPSWGGMINESRLFIMLAPWTVVFPGTFLAVTVLALNLLGDALRDLLDPRLRNAL